METMSQKSYLSSLEEQALQARVAFDLPALELLNAEAKLCLDSLDPESPEGESYRSFLVLCDGFAEMVRTHEMVFGETLGETNG